jgi:hypothetical protein
MDGFVMQGDGGAIRAARSDLARQLLSSGLSSSRASSTRSRNRTRSGLTQAPCQRIGDRGRNATSAVALSAAGLGPAWCSRRKKGGGPVTYVPTVICEVVAS